MSEPRDPMRAAQANMRQPTVRRFYKSVDVREAEGGGFALMLDGRRAADARAQPARRREPRAHADASPRNGRGRAKRSIRPTCR